MVKCCYRGYATSEILVAGRQVRPSPRHRPHCLSLSSARIGTSVLVPSYASDDDIAGVLRRTQFSALRIRRRIVSRAECGESSARRNCHRGTGALGQYPPNCVQVASEAATLLQAQSSVRFRVRCTGTTQDAVWEHGSASSGPVALSRIAALCAAPHSCQHLTSQSFEWWS